MPSAAIAPAGWNFTASGNTSDKDTTHQLRDSLEGLLDDERFGESAVTFSVSESGWKASANGASADPGDHAALLTGLRNLLAEVAYDTGSTEWVSPYGSETNFHVTRVSAPGDSTATSPAGEPTSDSSLPPVETPGY